MPLRWQTTSDKSDQLTVSRPALRRRENLEWKKSRRRKSLPGTFLRSGKSGYLELKVAYGAAHGTKCFTSAAALTDGETIILSYIDEFQFMDAGDGVTGVPNSDAGFGENIAEGRVLASKRVNADYYSANMAKSGSTVAIDANYDAIQNHINGMTIADAAALGAEENPVDAISGATLADTAGYINAVVAAAQE